MEQTERTNRTGVGTDPENVGECRVRKQSQSGLLGVRKIMVWLIQEAGDRICQNAGRFIGNEAEDNLALNLSQPRLK